MFKNLITYRIGGDMPASAADLEEALKACVFAECMPTQPASAGWAPPRGVEHGALVEAVDGHWIIQLKTQKRLLPSSVIDERVDELAEHIEETTGRKPGKKARKDLKEQAVHELLPRAFTKTGSMLAWIDVEARTFAVDAGSQARADELVSLFVQHPLTGRMNLSLLQTQQSPAACMAAWLMDGVTPEGFGIDSDAELRGLDEQKPVVKYNRHPLDIDEVKAHLTAGKMPTKLGMSYRDRVAFQLTDAGQIKRLSFLDLAFEGRAEAASGDAFDADVALATGELRQLLAATGVALGGEFVSPIEAAAAAEEAQAPVAHHGNAETDPMYDQAVAIVVTHRKASISLVQRHLRIGYNRAARLLERMEKEGVCGPLLADGGRALLQAVPA